jgi:hypothetical protein
MSKKQAKRSKPVTSRISEAKYADYDWQKLHDLWIKDAYYERLSLFLVSQGVDPDELYVRAKTKTWAQTKEITLQAKAALQKNLDENSFNAIRERVLTDIRRWRIEQCRTDYIAAARIKETICAHLERMISEDNVKTFELINLAKALESVQRVQRLALGMSTDNIGVEDARKIAEDAAGDSMEKDDVPTFEVAVNEAGKFKRLRPTRIN